MAFNLILINIGMLVLLTVLMEKGLRKMLQSRSVHVKRIFWLLLFPTYIATLLFSLLIMFPVLESEYTGILNFQKYSFWIHLISILYFIAALDGERVLANAKAVSTKLKGAN